MARNGTPERVAAGNGSAPARVIKLGRVRCSVHGYHALLRYRIEVIREWQWAGLTLTERGYAATDKAVR